MGLEVEVADIHSGWEDAVDEKWVSGLVHDPVQARGKEPHGKRCHFGALNAHLLELCEPCEGGR